MSTKWIWALFAVVLLAACQREQPTTDIRGAADATLATPEKRAARRAPAVLADDYLPSFRHKIRSQRHVKQGTRFRHVVIMEFFEIDPASAIDTVRSELTDRGFDVADAVEHDGRTRLAARKGSLRLVADIVGSVKVNDPSARGIAYFTWIDGKPR